MKAFVLVAALALVATSAEAATRKKSRNYAKPPRATSGQIACTQVGCLPVPRGCHPAPGRTWNGDPTGFDVMVCGGGAYTMYGRR